MDLWNGSRDWLGLTFLMVHWLITVSIWVGSPCLEWIFGMVQGTGIRMDLSDGSLPGFECNFVDGSVGGLV